MRIGIDVSSLCSNWDGIGTYVMDMVNYLSKLDCDDKFYLYSNVKTVVPLPESDKFVICADRCGNHLMWMDTRLPKYMKRDRLDVFWQPNYLMPIKVSGIKNVVTIHDMSAYSYSEYASTKTNITHKLFLKLTCKKADTILAISNNGAEEIIKSFPKEKNKVKTIYIGKKMFANGLDANEADVKECLSYFHVQPKNYLLFVGTLSPRKNAEVIVKGYFKYRNQGGKKKLVLAGNISAKSENVKILIEASEYRDDVIIAGYVSDLQKRIFYYHAAMLLFPSRLEGFGFPILEAMQAEIPVITSNCSCMPEIAGDAAIYLNDIDSPDEMASRIFDVEQMSLIDRENLIELGKKRVQYFDQMNYPQLVLQELLNTKSEW